MTSEINIEEFRKRLKLNTKLGNPKISGTPFHAFNMFGQKDKKFYGSLNQNDFQITANAILHPIPYILNGKIKPKNANQTELVYDISPIKFGYYWIKYFPIGMFIILNIIFIIQKPPIFIAVIFNLFLIIGGVILNLRINKRKRNFEKNFREIFEIT